MKIARHILIIACLIAGYLPAKAQYPLEKDLNMIRGGDTITKQQVMYKDPGRSGKNVFWDYSHLTPVNESYKVAYRELRNGDIQANENRTSYFYHCQDDTLFTTAYDNLTTRFDFRLPEAVLKYPFSYSDSLSAPYYGEGIYGRKMYFRSSGVSVITADAHGTMLLPGGDTLRHVTRIHTIRYLSEQISASDSILLKVTGDSTTLSPDTILSRLQNDSLHLVSNIWRWYARGYRYPVFETRLEQSVVNGLAQDYFSTAFYFSPSSQEDLIDELNEEIREEETNGKEQPGHPSEPSPGGHPGEMFAYNLYPNPVKDILQIEYYLAAESVVGFSLLDSNGRLLIIRDQEHRDTGVYRESLDLSGYPSGSYTVMLRVNNVPYGQVVLKHE